MKHRSWIIVLTLCLLGASASEGKKVYPNRWVFAGANLRTDRDIGKIRQIVQTASAHGLTGIVLSAGLDQLDLQSPESLQRLKEIRRICADARIEIIPCFMSAGYGGAVLAHDKNLAAGLPVKDALYVADKGEARFVPDPAVGLVNGGFERREVDRPAGFILRGAPGGSIILDTEVFKEGKASVRFENFDRAPEKSVGISQEVAVKPYRCYRLRCWVRSKDLNPSDPFGSGNFRLEVLGVGDDRRLQYENPRTGSTPDWHEVAVGFNSWGYDKVRVSPVVEGGANGKFWLDDLRLDEVGLVNLLRRPGTPLTVRNERSGEIYEEGRDYAQVSDPLLNFRYDHEGPAIRLLPGSRIVSGDRLRVSYFHGVSIYNGQVPLCMSEPKLYEIWQTQARLVHEALEPQKYLLSQDEIRVGGSCEACKKRGMTMGQILGDCITRQYDMLRQVNPKAEIFVWSDMLDPNHNANPAKKHYYLTEGTFVGSWNYVPKDIVITCWYYEVREKSLKHFSGLGFRTLAGAYYDADTLDNPKGWLEALDATPGACGIMYTTWLNKYQLLAPFGDLVSAR